MRPPSFISGSARCVSRLSASALVSRHQRQCFNVISVVGLSTPLAALLTRMSTRSKCLPNSAKSSSTLEGMPTLAWIATARRPSARTSLHNASASSALL